MGKALMTALWVMVAVTLASQASALAEQKTDNLTFAEAFTQQNFDDFFPHKDSPLAHAQGFYDYNSFLVAAGMYADTGFGLVGGSVMQKQEIAAFLAHAAHETTCGWSKSVDGPYAWGLCYNQDLSPASIYCQQDVDYPCVNGVSYHRRGVLPLVYNYNYGSIGNAMKLPFLSYPGLVANNATIAFATGIYQWVTKLHPNPSAHSAMVGEWKPTKADTAAFRTAGFGLTINILAGQTECGHGDDVNADDRIAHYTRFTEILQVPLTSNLDCDLQGMLPTGFDAVL